MRAAEPMIELDGRTGEGGGQLVRNAVALAAVTSRSVRIVHIRGNRVARSSSRKAGGGLKAQHVSAVEVLARATDAQVEGLSAGSNTLSFRPRRGPGPEALAALMASPPPPGGETPSQTGGEPRRLVRVVAGSAASSTMLIFQAVFPFLLFAGDAEQEQQQPIELEIEGGTNASWAPTFDYVDQVLCPALEARFGLAIERALLRRGWNSGPAGRGSVWFRFRPLAPGRALLGRACAPAAGGADRDDVVVNAIAVTLVCPSATHAKLTRHVAADLAALFPDADVSFRPPEESGHRSRVFALLVAQPAPSDDDHDDEGASPPPPPLLWGRDMLAQPSPRPGRAGAKDTRRGQAAAGSRDDSTPSFAEAFSRRLCGALHRDVAARRGVDEFLQDQLVIFQALAEGRTGLPRRGDDDDTEPRRGGGAGGLEEALGSLRLGAEGPPLLRTDRTDGPFGEGSLHAATARWVAARLLPGVRWFDEGRVCEGVGFRVVPSGD